MAKVRIQTRKKGREEAAEKGDTLPQPAHASALHPKDEGAIDILARVLKTEGFVGWYKVGFSGLLLPSSPVLKYMFFRRVWALKS
jgi:hypothetical protein